MSGYFSEVGKPVTWRGLKAVYVPAERAIMRELPVREQAVIHLLKAAFTGEVREQVNATGEGGENPPVKSQPGPAPVYANGGVQPVVGLAVNDPHATGAPTQYIDAEDIPFGEGLSLSGKPDKPRKRPIYALVWTWKQYRVHKTKKRCEKKQRAWKKWYERQGWKVTNHGTGYFALSPQGERHSISLHEYDPESKERVK